MIARVRALAWVGTASAFNISIGDASRRVVSDERAIILIAHKITILPSGSKALVWHRHPGGRREEYVCNVIGNIISRAYSDSGNAQGAI